MSDEHIPAVPATSPGVGEFGVVIPVLGASAGVGVSVTAAALADTAGAAGHATLLVDAADPHRSGLARAVRTEGPPAPGPQPRLRMRFSWRGPTLLARLDSRLPVVEAGQIPPPPQWRVQSRRIGVTVVDIGVDPWPLATNPTAGPGLWLARRDPAPRPVLVCRATGPSVERAEQILARLRYWSACGVTVDPGCLVVVGARRWPRSVAARAGRYLAPLLEEAIFLPWQRHVAREGVTADRSPHRLRTALAPILPPHTSSPPPAGAAVQTAEMPVASP